MLDIDVINAVIENRPENGWVVFRYNTFWAVLGFIEKLFYVILFGSISYILFFWKSNNKNNSYYVMGSIFFILNVLLIYVLIKYVKNMFYWNTNMIVLTDEFVLKSMAGKIDTYPYSCIADLKMVRVRGQNIFPTSYIEFVDVRNNKDIEFINGRIFGKPEKIYNYLLTKAGK